jgi:uncharacterized protein
MKTDLNHLPPNKQEEILAITQIIKDVVAPEKIILFGSYATGRYRENRYFSKGIEYEYTSDYDFLVVTKENPSRAFNIESQIRDRVDRYKPPVNLEIHSIDYINEGLGWGQYFFSDIMKEGVLLYDSGQTKFTEPRILSPKEKKEKAQGYFNMWFPEARPFIEGAQFFYANSNFKQGAFLLHQAAEDLYNATQLVFSDYKPRIHNLWKLRKRTKMYSEKLFLVFRTETDKQEESLFDLLKRAYVEARYNPEYVIAGDELLTLIDRVIQMEKIVKEICIEKIQSLGAEA